MNKAKTKKTRRAGKKTHRAKRDIPSSAPAATPVSYDSIAAAAAAIGVEKSALRKAKREGAPGFRGSRVYPADLLPWLKERAAAAGNSGLAEQSKEALECKFLSVRIQKLEFDFAAHRGEYVLASDAQKWSMEMVTEFRKVLESVPSTLAADIVGVQSVADAELKLRTAIEQALALLHLGPWAKSPAPQLSEPDPKV